MLCAKGFGGFKAILAALGAVAFIAAGSAGHAKELENGDLFIPVEEVSETAVFYPIDVDGTKMEVFAVKAPDGTIRTAFNTCQVCYGSGRGYYIQQGSVFVCQNCGNRFRTSDIERVRGGCNPLPITSKYKSVDETGITIPRSLFVQVKQVFQNWKR